MIDIVTLPLFQYSIYIPEIHAILGWMAGGIGIRIIGSAIGKGFDRKRSKATGQVAQVSSTTPI